METWQRLPPSDWVSSLWDALGQGCSTSKWPGATDPLGHTRASYSPLPFPSLGCTSHGCLPLLPLITPCIHNPPPTAALHTRNPPPPQHTPCACMGTLPKQHKLAPPNALHSLLHCTLQRHPQLSDTTLPTLSPTGQAQEATAEGGRGSLGTLAAALS